MKKVFNTAVRTAIVILITYLSCTTAMADDVYVDYFGDTFVKVDGKYYKFIPDENVFAFSFFNEEGINTPKSVYEGVVECKSEIVYNGKTYPVVYWSDVIKNYNNHITDVIFPSSIKSTRGVLWSSYIDRIILNEGLENIGPGCIIQVPYDSHYGEGLTELVIPSTVTNISYAIADLCYLKYLKLPDNLVKLGDKCCYSLPKLTEISLPETLEEMGELCFSDCGALKEVKIPESMKKIGNGCFKECSSLQTVILPSHPVEMNQAFQLCHNLRTVITTSPAYDIPDNNFTFVNETFRLLVPPGEADNYRAAKGWSRFKNIIEYNAGVNEPDASAVSNVVIAGNTIFAVVDMEVYNINGNSNVSLKSGESAQLDCGCYVWKSTTESGKFMIK